MKKNYKISVRALRATLLSILLFCSSALMAQISNQQFHFSCPGGVTITYDLACDVEDVTLWYSTDMSSWAKAIAVSGDVGTVSAGNGKTILWDNAADHVKNGNFYFKIKTSTFGCFTCMSNTYPTTAHIPTAFQQVSVPITVSTTKDVAGNWVHEQAAGATATITLKFLTYNLGANPNLSPKEQMKQVYAASQNDIRVYGGFYQWGRKDAGHTLRCNMADAPAYFLNANGVDGYPIASYNPATDTKFVWHASLTSGWWANGEVNNSNLWGNGCTVGTRCPTSGAAAGTDACPTASGCFGGNNNVSKRPNDPCPSGYRVPTEHEWALLGWEGGNSTTNTKDENTSITNDITVSKSGLVWVRVCNGFINGSWSANNMCGYAIYDKSVWDAAYPSPPPSLTTDLTSPSAPTPLLFLPAAGFRDYYDGVVYDVGTYGYYWSSTVNSNFSYFLYITSGNVFANVSNVRAIGLSVRCVAEL